MNGSPSLPRWAATAIALVTAIIALITAIANNGDNITKIVHTLSPGQKAAIQRSIATAPNPACNPPLGSGKMGVCAPPTAPLNPLLGAPRVLHGLLGVDVSSYQGCGNLSGVSFAFVKLNESTGYRNASASCTARQARSRRVPLGAYDFLRPGRTSPEAEAATFVSMYRALGLRGPAVADVEATVLSPAGTRGYVSRWHSYVARHLKATRINYTGVWFWNPRVGGPAGSSNLWVSSYANTFYRPAGFRSALVWQYSDGTYGPYPHIHGYDSNIFLGSRSKLNAVFRGGPVKRPISKANRKLCGKLNRLRSKHSRPKLRAKIKSHFRHSKLLCKYPPKKHRLELVRR